ncbi:MAG: TetR/AcrR family transcriptional regulator [Planctomycetota bacterium]
MTPKKREIAEREARILAVARPMVVQNGYHGINMDRIAEEVGYSKGTIYNHFSCKEEVIIALAVESSSKRVEFFRKAAEFKGCARHRMHAIGYAAERFVRDYPEFFQFEKILELQSVREKTSEKRQAVVQGCEMQCMSVVAGIVRDAVSAGDLKLQKAMSPEELVFGLWSLTSGAFSIILSSDSLTQMGMKDPWQTVRTHILAVLDGFNWQPLSSEYDAEKLRSKIRREVLA